MGTATRIREIHWVKAYADEVYKCGNADLETAPEHWVLDEPHPWILLIPDVDSVETAFAYSRTSKIRFEDELKDVRLIHEAHNHALCCIDLRGVVQHAPEERVEVVISDFIQLVTAKSIKGQKRGTSYTCGLENDSWLIDFIARLKSQFAGEYLFRKRKNDY